MMTARAERVLTRLALVLLVTDALFVIGLGSVGFWLPALNTRSRAPSAPMPNPVSNIPGVGMIARDHPLAGGVEVQLDKVPSLMKTPIFLPSTSQADSFKAQAWIRTGNDEYLLVIYASGLQVEERPWSSLTETPAEHWRALMVNEDIPGSMKSGNGVDMFVVAPSDTSGGSVDFVQGGTWVSVYGEGLFTSDVLVSIASSAAQGSAG